MSHVVPGRATNNLNQSVVLGAGLVQQPTISSQRHVPTFCQDGDSAVGPRAASKAVLAEDVWAFQAQQRAKTSKTKLKDIGDHRPSLDELAPLLEKHAAGQLTFNDLLPIQKHSAREVVGWLHMVAGALTKDIDLDTAMASLLFGNRDLGLDTSLADIVKCEKDMPNRVIKWGIASKAALNKLRGVTMHIQVARNGTKQGFSMTSPHVLDGFFLDIPQGLQGVAEERLLFDVMARLEPHFLWGTSCYRLHFLGNTVPSSLHRDGPMVEEFIFLDRRLRVYGQGWFFRDKQLVRIDLDKVALTHGLYGNTASRQDHRDTSMDPKPMKKAKVSHVSESQWTTVKPVRSKANLSLMDEALTESSLVYTPKTTVHEVDCVFKTSGEFTSGTKIESSRPVRVECSLDAILAELAVLDAKSIEAANQLPAQLNEACSKPSFNLASLVADGRVDSICSCLERYPVAFGIQVHQLFKEDRPMFEYFVRQRLLHRWFRATWGGSMSFDQLYKASFGQPIPSSHTTALFSNTDFAAATKPMAITDANGDDRELHWTDVEAVLALTECPVTAIASHKGSRCLSSETIGALLMDTDLGAMLWESLEDMYSGDSDDDIGMRLTFSTILEFHEQGCFDVTATNQIVLCHRSLAEVIADGLFNTTPVLELTTCNLNGLNANGHLVAQRLNSPTQCVLFQEAKLNNSKHLDTFKFHLSNEVGADAYKLFTNDHRALRSDSLNHRSCGVASYFHSSMPGFDGLQHLIQLDLPDRYLVVRTYCHDKPVHFHNVHAPVLPHLR
ncbi:hypothetical protein H310_12218 [Aphanomyces invadans]|uniref:Uncharacterized protein n=1 Tax=Aphanomyces invadans TaxID=157072 RepID=A0A024TI99_9STRA|nr:hypothetical protein H310_12218 [Aphanomyces invadans]ETV93870.1 hypothetical protein H310_12218 [Aphanomyces invadans]|eukprot:XP_008877430.1 hypothetical protein H310_12218 [Aphanomyces invadans]